MIASEKSHQNLPDYNQFLLKKIELDQQQIFSSEKIRNSAYCIYNYSRSFFREDF